MSKPDIDKLITSEAKRLLVLPGNPGDSTELARALKRHAKTEYHIRAIVQHLLDNSEFCPTPAAIANAAEIALSEPPPKFRPPDPMCAKCGGTGRIFGKRSVTTGPYPGVYEGVADCTCRIVSKEQTVLV